MDYNSFFLMFSPAWFLISFLLYWPVFFRYQNEGRSRSILMLRYYGAFLFGGVPLLVSLFAGFPFREVFGLGFNPSEKINVWLLTLGLGLVIIIVNYFISGSRRNLEEFPQIKDANWSKSLFFGNIFSWLIYLIGYEFLFRGVLLFPLVPVLGFWTSAILGTVLYSLSHFPKNLREALGAIPFGIILAWIAWHTQSVWPCIWIHVCLAISNSIFSWYHHPNMKIKRRGE